MGMSVKELKTALAAVGVDYSQCVEKVELQNLFDSLASAAPLATSYSGILDESFAVHESSARNCWVEFAEDGEDAMVHWGDGTESSIVPVVELKAISIDDFQRPRSFPGSFEDARAAAFRDEKLLVVALQSSIRPKGKTEHMHVLSLSFEDTALLIEENAVFWRGSSSDLRQPHLEQLAPKGPPSVAMVLPLAQDAMRVLSHAENVTPESVTTSFVEALEAHENHRKTVEARVLCEDALLRQEQDDEYLASLAVDQQLKQHAAHETVTADERSQSTCDTDIESSKRARDASDEERLAKVRRLQADEFASSVPACSPEDATTKIVLRLPNGERVERTFGAEESFSRVRMWVGCCQYLPEARERDLQIPAIFKISTAFPPHSFTDEEDNNSLKELSLVPSAALLVIRCES